LKNNGAFNNPGEKNPGARQNVILELGYFAGKLGRSNVCVLNKGNVEIPSDFDGIVYTPMDESGAWKFKLASELKSARLTVDINDLAKLDIAPESAIPVTGFQLSLE
jgi:predicted nucleotide-binding protein